MPRTTVVARWSILTVAILTLMTGLAACGQESTRAGGQSSDQAGTEAIDKASRQASAPPAKKSHNAVVDAYNKAKDELKGAEDKIKKGGKEAYDKAKSTLKGLESKLSKAKGAVGHKAVEAYRSVQHKVGDLMGGAERVLNKDGHKVWNGIKGAYRDVHQKIDNVIDDLHQA